MANDQSMSVDAVRKRFTWVGLAELDEPDLSSRYREIMAESTRDREIAETIDSIRRSA